MFGVLASAWRVFAPAGRRLRWLWVAIVGIAVAGLEYVTALLVFGVLDEATGAGQSGDLIPSLDIGLTNMLVLAGAAFLLREIVGIAAVYVTERVVLGSSAVVSTQLHRQYLYAPYEFHLRRNSSELVRTALLSVETAAGEVVRPALALVIQAPSILVLGLLLILISPVLTVGALAVVATTLLLVLGVVQPWLKRLGVESEHLAKSMLSSLTTSFQSVREIKAYGSEPLFDRRYQSFRFRTASLNVTRFTVAAVPSRVLEFVVLAGLLAVIGVAQTGTSFTDVIPVLGVFAYATLRLVPAVSRSVSALNKIRFGGQAMRNVEEDIQKATIEPAHLVAQELFERQIELREVGYEYPGDREVALSDVTLTIHKGEKIAVVGPSGAGKSTLVDLILGLVEPTEGVIVIDGETSNSTGLRGRSGVVSQQVILFDGTLQENVVFGEEQPDHDRLERALKAARLDEWVAMLPEGVDTPLGESGKLASGGQRQRIALARSLYREPEVLVLDEATSDLDAPTEMAVLDAIDELLPASTIVMVSHRPAPVEKADTVVLLEQGTVTDSGSYTELLQRRPELNTLIGKEA